MRKKMLPMIKFPINHGFH